MSTNFSKFVYLKMEFERMFNFNIILPHIDVIYIYRLALEKNYVLISEYVRNGTNYGDELKFSHNDTYNATSFV